jgi:PTH2 family peptidyl-tRNA hydrolase
MSKNSFRYKQVIIIISDLGMSKGKTAAQTAHAAITAMENTKRYQKKWVKNWLREGQKKVILKAETKEEILRIKNEVENKRIPCALIQDRGLTEIPAGSITALGIGPCPNNLIDPITGDLKLL